MYRTKTNYYKRRKTEKMRNTKNNRDKRNETKWYDYTTNNFNTNWKYYTAGKKTPESQNDKKLFVNIEILYITLIRNIIYNNPLTTYPVMMEVKVLNII